MTSSLPRKTLKIAVEGCSHGELDSIYASIARAEQAGNFKTDVLLLCGDFQAIRNVGDLECIAVPPKYRTLGCFHRYYSGEKTAPMLTLVVGGNHEASNYLWEVANGGWLAPNIYFLGEAGCVTLNGITIAGASGIYKSHDYHSGRHEQVPYSPSDMRSVYHTRVFDIWRLKLLASGKGKARPDILMSHDWPNTIEQHGDVRGLIKRKPFFKDEIHTGTLGSPPLLELLKTLKPKYWFAAHLHVKFAALYKHGGEGTRVGEGGRGAGGAAVPTVGAGNPEAIDIDLDESDVDEEPAGARHDQGGCSNQEEIAIDDDDDDNDNAVAGPSTAPQASTTTIATASSSATRVDDAPSETRFLALSKCLPGHQFLQFFDMPCEAPATTSDGDAADSKPILRYHPRWLAILRATNHFMSLQKRQPPLPAVDDAALLKRIDEEEAWVRRELMATKDGEQEGHDPLAVENVQRFMGTAPSTLDPQGSLRGPPPWFTNPQTEALCRWLQIENKINAPPPMPPMPQPGMMMMPPPPGMGMAPGGFAQPPPPPLLPHQHQHQQQGVFGQPLPSNGSTDEPIAKRHKMDGDAEADGNHGGQGSGSGSGPEAETELAGRDEAIDAGAPLRLDDEDEGAARWKEGTG